MITSNLNFAWKNDLLTWLIAVIQPITWGRVYLHSLSISLSLSLSVYIYIYIYIYIIITIKKKIQSTFKLFVNTHGYRQLPNIIILNVLCILFFRFFFFFPVVCLEIFLRSKIFSQSILIIFELPLFYNLTHLSWHVQNFHEKRVFGDWFFFASSDSYT